MNRNQKKRYLFAVYIILALLAIIIGLVAFNRSEDYWQAILLNLSTELLGIVFIFFLVNYFFALDEWSLSDRAEKLIASLELLERNSSRDYFLENLSGEQQQELNSKIEKAKDLLIIGVTLKTTLDLYYPLFEQKLRHGDTIKIVLEAPDSHASQMTVKRRYRSISPSSWRTEVEETLQGLEKLKTETGGKLEVRIIDCHLTHGAILTDKDTPNGLLFIWYYGFKTKKENQPKFLLYPSDRHWYDHFNQEANEVWKTSVLR